MNTLNIVVPGVPESQGSARAFVVAGKARITTSNKKLTSWRRDAIVAVREAMREQNWERVEQCSIEAEFVFPRPQSHYGSGSNAGQLKPNAPSAKTTKPDIDKLIRAVLDALDGAGLYQGDERVVQITCRKRYVHQGEGPRAVVAVIVAGGHLILRRAA